MMRKVMVCFLILIIAVTSVAVPAFAQDEVTIEFWIPGGRGRDRRNGRRHRGI